MKFRLPHPAHLLLVMAVAMASLVVPPPAQAAHDAAVAPVRHVFIIVLENEPFQVTFGPKSLAPYLAHKLPKQGALLTQYYGIGHN